MSEKADELDKFAAAINRRDLDMLAALLHPEFEFHAVIGSLDETIYSGLAGIRSFLEDMDSTWDRYRVELEGFHESADQVALRVHATGRARISGVPLDQHLGELVTWRDGLVWRIDAYTDPDDAVQAIGHR